MTIHGLLTDSSRSFRLRNGLVILTALLQWTLCQRVSPPTPKKDNSPHWLTHPRASALCAQSFNGFEGTSIKGFTLDRAIAVVTPGLTFRPTADSLLNRGYSNSHCRFKKYAKTHQSQKIKSYTEILNVKDRIYERLRKGSAFKILKPVPISHTCKENMLTPHGIAQGVQLGEYLTMSYSKQLNSLSSITQELLELAHSVGDELLYQSILAVLYGLLGEKQFVYADVGKLSQHHSDDKKSRVKDTEHLTYFIQQSFKDEHHLFKDYSYPTSDRWRIDSEFGRSISAKDILASLSLNHCDQSMDSSDQPSHDLIESILSVSDSHNRYLLNSSIFQNYSKSTTLPFRKFLKSLILSSHKKKKNDFKLISVDELLMLKVLSALDLTSIEHIPPASRLVIERFHFENFPSNHPKQRRDFPARPSILPSTVSSLEDHVYTPVLSHKGNPHKVRGENVEANGDKIDSKNMYFRVLYNGRVVTSELWNCGSDFLVSLGLCSLPAFAVALGHDGHLDVNSSKEEL